MQNRISYSAHIKKYFGMKGKWENMKKIARWFLILSSGVLSILLCLLFLHHFTQNVQHLKAKDIEQETDREGNIGQIIETPTESQQILVQETKELQTEKQTETEELGELGSALKPVILYLDGEPEILLGGDVCLQDFIVEKYDAYGIEGILTQNLIYLMKDADITMVNQEFAFSDRGEAQDKQYTYRMSPAKVKIFKELGIDIVTLANNHALDYGREALDDTFLTLENADIRYVGAGENLNRAKKMEVIEVQGKKIGFLGASRVIPVAEWNAGESVSGMLTTYSPDILLNEIREGKKDCDFLIVYVHWGEERENMPEDYQRTMAKQYIDAGADAVIGSHPHVMQGVEYYKEKPILYSLGNYIFSTRTRQCSLAKLKLKENGEITVQFFPFEASSFPIRLMNEQEKKEFFFYMESISFGITIDEDGNVVYN